MAAEMQALAMQLSTAMCAKSGNAALAEWAAVAAEAWACIEAETLVAKASPLSPPPPPEPRRLPLQCVANQCTVRKSLPADPFHILCVGCVLLVAAPSDSKRVYMYRRLFLMQS